MIWKERRWKSVRKKYDKVIKEMILNDFPRELTEMKNKHSKNKLSMETSWVENFHESKDFDDVVECRVKGAKTFHSFLRKFSGKVEWVLSFLNI